jgi:protein O-GlcNAc transferase
MTLRTPQDIRLAFQEALRHHQAGKLAAAERGYRNILAADPAHRDSLHLLGAIHLANKKFPEARAAMEKALALGPDVAAICFNLARCLEDMDASDDAIQMYRRAQKLAPQDADIPLGLGNVLSAQEKWTEAIGQFDAALTLSPRNALALNNKALALKNLGKDAEAITCFDKAIALRPGYEDALCNKGVLLQKMRLWEEARVCFSAAIAANPRSVIALHNRGALLDRAEQYAEAIADYRKALAVDENLDELQGLLMQARLRICDWDDLAPALAKLERGVLAGKPICQPMVATRALQSREAILTSARLQSKRNPKRVGVPAFEAQNTGQKKIHIGYISSDMHGRHPVYQAMIGVLEHHDRETFDVSIFHLPTEDKQPRPDRLMVSDVKHHELIDMSGKDCVELIRRSALDIAIDLNGHTKFNWQSILSARVAPVQVNYLGFPGSMGSAQHDYIIGDATLMPLEHHQSYNEKVVWMPNSFFPVDGKRPLSSAPPTRASQGLPETAFVFGCFCTIDRILPSTFTSWMNILKQVPNAVLWLKIAEGPARERIVLEAKKRGVGADRLVFAARTESNADHLARVQLMDLCLDTQPYNAHMTAVDALYVGVPILTLLGETFAGRVAASLLHTMGFPDLICSSRSAYENMAISLASDRAALASIRNTLNQNQKSSSLFDTKLYTQHLELAFKTMVTRYKQGLSPAHFAVADGLSLMSSPVQ